MEKTRIKDIFKTSSGCTPTSSNPAFYDSDDYRWLNSSEVAGRIYDTKKYISEKAFKKYTALKVYPKDTVVIAMYGATVGEIGILKVDSTTNQAVCAILPNYEIVNPDYFYYKMLNEKQNLIGLASGSARTNISQQIIADYETVIPIMDEQNKVADVLCTIDDLIEVNSKIIETSERLMREIYDYWFVQFDFPNESGRPYKSSGGAMVYNETLKREIPKGWKVESLVNCVSKEKNAIVDGPFGTQMKIEDYVESGVPIYEMDQLNGAFITKENKHFITEQKYEEVKRSTVKNGDIIISKTGTLGLLGLVRSQYSKGIIVSRLAKITPNPNIIGKYALLIYLSKLTKNGYWLNMCGGSTMPILNNSIISRTKIVVPNSDLYQRFETVASPIYEQIYNLQLETQKLISLRDWLLPMLMNGQIVISQ